MNPAFSVIFFTVMSGCGYGLLFLLGIAVAIDPHALPAPAAWLALLCGAAAVIAGLLSSTLHLGQPQRAWRAFSQWRTSWLSREGVASVASFAPMLGIAACLWLGNDGAAMRASGMLMALLALLTVACTAGIYTSLPTIPAWHNRFVLAGYLLMALLGGAAWAGCIFGWTTHGAAPAMLAACVAVVAALTCLWLKQAYWRDIDTAPPIATTGSATGLDRFGAVRAVESPNTEQNYLTHEMGFVLARKHGVRLRAASRWLFGIAALLLALASLALQQYAPLAAAIAASALAASVTAGLFVERWLFFAQARHVVMRYYDGARPA